MTVTAIRTVIIYVTLVVAMRLMGKRQLGDMQPIELVVTLLIADLAAIPMQEPGTPLVTGIAAIFVLVALEILFSVLRMKSPGFGRLVSGSPMVVIKDGKPLKNTLRRLRLTNEDLTDTLRTQGVFDLREVDTAIVETNGKISVFLKADKQPANKGDLAVMSRENMPLPVVSDGAFCNWALEAVGWNKAAVCRALARNRTKLCDVFLMTAAKDGTFAILKTEEVCKK